MTATRILLSSMALSLASFPAFAHSVMFEENFDGDYSANFPTMLDIDHLSPTAKMQTLFLDGSAGVTRPWWPLKDASTSTDRFMSSHSSYNPAGTSNDWLCSRAIEIPSEGYMLTFDAQSASLSGNTRLSDLWLFITSEPVTEENIPQTPTQVFKEVPVGESEDIIEGDFTSYSLSLDEYIGQTIYLNFANLNHDRDILAIDNVLVRRLDNAELSFSAPRYVEAGKYSVEVTVKATSPDGLDSWSLDFIEEGIGGLTYEGPDRLEEGESISFPVESNVGKDQTIDFTLKLKTPGAPDIIQSGSVSGLSFIPWHSVLVEESTGLWCGNCPTGAYIMESMSEDPEMSRYVCPVSVHIAGSGNDMMVNQEYSYLFAVNTAPAFRFDRDSKVAYASMEHDTMFNPSNPLSLAGAVKALHEEIALLGVELEARFTNDERNAISCDVTVNPALTLDASQLGIGFILTENNVGLDNNPYWIQENYLSGLPYESELGGWTLLPSKVVNARFHDVARGVWGYRGLAGSIPSTLECDTPHSFSYTFDVPDTYQDTILGGETLVTAPAINPDYLSVIAYVYDNASGRVMNSAYFPMTEITGEKFTPRDLVDKLGVETVGEETTDAEPVFYNLQGRRVENPSAGVYIRRQGNSVSKVIIR